MQKVIQKVQKTKDSRRNQEIARLSRDLVQVCENDPPSESARASWEVFKRQVTETRPTEALPTETVTIVKRAKMKCTTSNEPTTML